MKKKTYLIDAFGFLYRTFNEHLSGTFDFDLIPESAGTTENARVFVPKNFLAVRKLYASGKIREYDVVHFNRAESFFQFKRIDGQISVFEIHGYDVGIRGKDYLKDLHVAWKRAAGLGLDRLISDRIARKAHLPDILYVSTPDLVEPIHAWCGRLPVWLPNAIDVSQFSPDGEKKKLAGSPACFLAARLHGDKKPEVAFDIFQNKILPVFPDAVLHLLDTGELAPLYKERYGNDPHYAWHGYMDKPALASVIRGADLVFGDFSIGALSLLPMQVMAAKRPIVSLDRYEILKEYSESLPDLAVRLLTDEAFKNAFVEKNAAYIHQMHDSKKITEMHLANLQKAGLSIGT